jgi:4'-phosphopantetheinyl transferase
MHLWQGPAVPTVVEIWRVTIDDEPPLADLHRGTTLDEQQQAARMIVPGAARRFLACRAALRGLLSQRLCVRPEDIPLRRGVHGKPELAPPWHDGWHFNVSHSADLGLVALCATAPVGVDLERLRPLEHFESMVRTALSPAERRDLQRLPPPQRLRQFFRYWTHKEALLKALGTGLSRPPTAVELRPTPRGALRVVQCTADAGRAGCVRELHLGADYCGAVAAADGAALHVAWHVWDARPARSAAPGGCGP